MPTIPSSTESYKRFGLPTINMSLLKGIRLQEISLMLILHPIRRMAWNLCFQMWILMGWGSLEMVDGATSIKTSMMNILASSPNKPSCVLDAIDCSKHMLHGSEKDAWFIAKNILPLMKTFYPCKDRINVVAFDGASNFKKAADLLKEHFPAITVMQGLSTPLPQLLASGQDCAQSKTFVSFLKR